MTLTPGERRAQRERIQEERAERVQPYERAFQTGLTGRQKQFAISKQKELMRLQEIALARGVGLPDEPSTLDNFLHVLRNLDRPRNAVHNLWLSTLRGDDETVWESLTEGWSFEEMAHFEDILAEYGMEAGLLRKVAGVGGDILLDPINIVPFGYITSRAGQLTGATKALALIGDKMAENPMARHLFVRWSRIPGMNDLINDKFDLNTYTEAMLSREATRDTRLAAGPLGLGRGAQREQFAGFEQADGALRQAADAAKKAGLKRNEGVGIVTRLAEEPSLRPIRELIVRRRPGNSLANRSIEEIDALIDGSVKIRNKDMARRLMRLDNEEAARDFIRAGEEMRRFLSRIESINAASGKSLPSFETGLKGALQVIDSAMTETLRRTKAGRVAERAEELARQRRRVRNLERTPRDAPGAREALEQELARLRRLEADAGPFKTAEEALAAFDDVTRNLNPLHVTQLRRLLDTDFASANSALQTWDRSLMTHLIEAIQEPNMQRMTADHKLVTDAIDNLPRWVPHMLTREAAEAMIPALKGGRGAWAKFFRNPRNVDAMEEAYLRKVQISPGYHRKPVVPLTIDEVNDLVRKKGSPRAFKDKPITKRRSLKELVTKQAAQHADFFEVSEAEILASVAQETARTHSAYEYIRDVAKHFGKNQADVSPDEWARLRRFSETPGLKALERTLPEHLRGLGFEPEILNETIRRHELMLNPSPVLKYFDTMQSLWKSYTLFLFPAYHLRNQISDHINMWSGGFMDNPMRSTTASWKALGIQWNMAVNNRQAARAYHVHYKSGNKMLNGVELDDIMRRNGVTDAGVSGGWISPEMRKMAGGLELGLRSYLPVSNAFMGIKWGASTARFMENQRRAAFFIHELEKGRDIRLAAARTKKFLGDYRSEIMTPFERDVLARVFPFYRWSRYNVPRQLDNLVTQGNWTRLKMMTTLRAADALSIEDIDASDLPGSVPDWIQESAGVPIRRDPETGNLEFFILQGWHPAADLAQIATAPGAAKALINNLSPFIRSSIETAAGVSLYRGEPLPESMEFAGTIMPGWLVNWLRNIRLLGVLDGLDPLRSLGYRTRYLRDDRRLETAISTLTGVTIREAPQAREQLNDDVERSERLRRHIGRAQKMIQLHGLDDDDE